MITFDIVIVGGGIVGVSSAYYLARKGYRVALLDQYDIPNEWSSSGDHAQIFRYTYGKDVFYTELAARSLVLWKEFQKEVREDLYLGAGVMDLADGDKSYPEACLKSLTQMKLSGQKIESAEMKERFRILSPRAARRAVFHPDGGILWAQRAVAAYTRASARRRAVISPSTRVAAVVRSKEGISQIRDGRGRVWKGNTYLFATGPWTKELFPKERLPLAVTRQQLLYFRPPMNQGRFRPGHCPVVINMARGYYVLPVHIHGFMKIGTYRKGPKAKPGQGSKEITPQFERACRDFLKEVIPDLYGFTESEGRICHHTHTPDGDFILDRLPRCPNAFVATGFSGNSFSFGPWVGSALTEWISTGKTELNLSRFRASRFKR
ncbi:MAG: FAD-dependent oxidoreductase [Elusimicrobia bacterium]|nr:FAD-dependent oxidoreductase [Elusimicrobiota bacterium]